MYFGPTLAQRPQYQLPSGFPTITPEPSGSDFDMAGIAQTLIRRKKVFVSLFLGFFSLVILWTLIVPRTYTATAKLIAGASTTTPSGTGNTDLPLLNALLAATSTQTAETYVDLIMQEPVTSRVINNLNLGMSSRDLLNKMTIKPVTNTSIIELDVTWSNPEMAARIANEFASVFVARERDLIAGQASSALDYLNKEMPVAQATMTQADNALAQFEAAHPSVYLTSVNNETTSSAVFTAQQRYAQAQVDKGQAQAQLSSISAELGALSPTINGASNVEQNPVTAQLQTQLAQVEVQLEAARKQYTDAHPAVLALKEQKSQLEREIGRQAQTIVQSNNIVPNPEYQQLSQQAAALRSQIAGDDAQLKTIGGELGHSGGSHSLPSDTIQLADLQRKAKMAEDVYSALQQKFGEATVAQTTALSDVSITQPAAAATALVKPSWIINLVLGFVLGLIVAVSGVFALEFFDNTFKNEEDVQCTIPLPLLTSVPHLTAQQPSKLPWLRALTVEAFQQLVTALRYSSDKPLRTLAITSPNQGDGKSTVAMSTAIAMAEIEPNVLLVDADLRRPKLAERLGLESKPGLSEILVGEITLADSVQKTKYDGLHFLSAGEQVPNPVKLLHSARLTELLGQMLKTYRAVVFDTPALLPVYDAALLGAKIDGTVMVVSAGMTDMPSTKKALQRLTAVQDLNLLGIVLNRATPTNGYQAYYLNIDNPAVLPHEDGVTSPS